MDIESVIDDLLTGNLGTPEAEDHHIDPDEWQPMQPLADAGKPIAYPIGNLPLVVREAVSEVEAYMQAPLGMIATSALTAASACVQGHYDVARDSRLRSPTSLFSLILAESGERKTAVDGLFMKPIHDYDRRHRDEGVMLAKGQEANFEKYEIERKALASNLSTVTRGGDAKQIEAAEKMLDECMKRQPKKARIPSLLIDDATPEAIIQSLAAVWPIGFLATNEGGPFFGGHGMKDESIMRNLAMFNQRWDGGRSKIMRSKAEPLEVDGVRLAACVMVQPSMMRKFMQSAGDAARGSGFLARFLIAWPESTQGYRPYKAPGAMLALESLNRRMTELLDTAPPLTPMHRVAPFTLELNAEGFEAWRDVYNVIESNLAQHGEYADIRDSASKAADNVARIAAVFHATEGTMGKIGADSINAAAEVVLWHLSETQRLFGGIVVDEPIQLAQSLESWLVSRGDAPMPLNEILQRVPNRKMRKKIVRDEAIGVLVSHGRARVIDVGGSSAIELHPSFFEEKA